MILTESWTGELKVYIWSCSDTDLLGEDSDVIHSKTSCYIFSFAGQDWNSQQLELLLIYSVGLKADDGFCRSEERAPVLSKEQHAPTRPLTHVHQWMGQSGQSHTLSGLERKIWVHWVKLGSKRWSQTSKKRHHQNRRKKKGSLFMLMNDKQYTQGTKENIKVWHPRKYTD